jgi:hypothetical protein
MSSRLWANNLTEIASLGLHGQVIVSSRGALERKKHEGWAQIAYDDRAFFCCVYHNDQQKTLIDKLKLSEKMKVQPHKTNKGITIVSEEGKVLAVTALESKHKLTAEFYKILPSFREFMQRIAKGLTVAEYTKPEKRKLLNCSSRYHPDMFDISLSGSDEDDEVKQ